MIRTIVIFDASDLPSAREGDLEARIRRICREHESVARHALGRNIHPMRPDLQMITHIWETEFNDLQAWQTFRSSLAVDELYRQALAPIRAGSITYAVSAENARGDLLYPGRIRRLHLTNFTNTATDSMKIDGDAALLSMPAAIAEIKAWALGYRIGAPDPALASFEHSWDTSFDSIADLQVYVTCDYHFAKTHDFAVDRSPKHIYRELYSGYYIVQPDLDGKCE